MNFSSYHQPYSHRTRFKVIRSTTTLIKTPKVSQFKIIRNGNTMTTKPVVNRTKSVDKSTTVVAKSIGNKYKWIKKKTDHHFKINVMNGRINKRKARASLSKCLVRIRGVKFQTNPNGKCLQRLISDSDASKIPVKKVEPPTKSRANILLQRSIQISNGRYRLRNSFKKKSRTSCIYFNRFGKCHHGDKCPFIHDPSRIAVCTQFLNGRCKNSSCPYSHVLTPGKVPTCSYFMKGACGQDNCPYAHSYVGHDAKVCEDFLQGFCAKGIECSKQHVLLCPQFESTGECPRGKQCHLTHRRKRKEMNILKSQTNSFKKNELSPPPPPLLPNEMPAYIPLNSLEIEKKTSPTEFKLKPSFLS